MSKKLDRIFKALADPSRRAILHSLVVSTVALNLTVISDWFQQSRQAITKHIKVLEAAGLVKAERNGREVLYTARSERLQAIQKWLAFYEAHWDTTLDDLNSYLNERSKNKT